jgi:ATP-dependent Zn protease
MAVKARKATKREEATAYHEAGHAVIAVAVRRPFRYVTISPSEDALGHVLHPPWGNHI